VMCIRPAKDTAHPLAYTASFDQDPTACRSQAQTTSAIPIAELDQSLIGKGADTPHDYRWRPEGNCPPHRYRSLA
jgi:hypothetical protein